MMNSGTPEVKVDPAQKVVLKYFFYMWIFFHTSFFPATFLFQIIYFIFFPNFSVANDSTFIITNMCISLIMSQLAFIGAENANPERVSML